MAKQNTKIQDMAGYERILEVITTQDVPGGLGDPET